ncbi:MAG: hypothetical protein M3Q30_25070 [Actinomycetota bacterium]|nr:hypothetical protein [Actinomycetota bacterium]
MVAAALDEVKNLVDKKFLLNAFFPVFVFLASCSLLVASANGGIGQWVDKWNDASGTVQAVIAASAVAVAFLLAAIALNATILLVRLYEGHLWPKPLHDSGCARQRKLRNKATQDVELRFPAAGKERATALGNVIGAAEDYPGTAFGAYSLVVWPRLFLLLPDTALAAAATPFDTMQFLLLLSFLSTVVAVAGGIYAMLEHLGGALFLVLVLGGLLVAWATYRTAVEAAVDYGWAIRAAFDVHRNDLLTKLRRPWPASPEEELRVWADVSERLQFPGVRPLDYTAEPEP